MGRQKYYYDHSQYAKDEFRRGLGYGLTFGIAASIGSAVLGGMVTAGWMHNNQIARDKARTEDVQYYQPQIKALLETQGIDLAEGTFPLISTDDNTFSFQIIQSGVSKICTAPFSEYYSSARIDPHIDLTKHCETSDKPMPSTPPEGYSR